MMVPQRSHWRPFMPSLTFAMRATLVMSLLLLTAAGEGDDPNHGVVFVYPTRNQIYNMLDTVNVTYTSPFPRPNLYLWCDGGGRRVSMQAAPGYNATVPVVLDFTSATPCWFNLRPGTVAGYGANTPAFNVIGQAQDSGPKVFGPSSPAVDTSTTLALDDAILPTQTATSNSESAPAYGTSSTPTSTADATTGLPIATSPPGTSGSGLSVATAAGIGAGVAVGVLAIVGGAFAWFWRVRRRKRGQHDHYDRDNDMTYGDAGGRREKEVAGGVVSIRSGQGPSSDSTSVQQDRYYQSQWHTQKPSELSAVHTPAELASSQVRQREST